MFSHSAQFFYIVAGVFAVSTFGLLIASVYVLRPFRSVFGWALIVPAVAGLAYFAMGKGIGATTVFDSTINITRYIDWMITTPALLYLLAYAMIPKKNKRQSTAWRWGGIMTLVLLMGLLGEITTGTVKALLFAVSSLTFLIILYRIVDQLLVLDTKNIGSRQATFALAMAWIILVLWTAYPIVWVLGPESIQLISLPTQITLYALLDVITKVVFAVVLLGYLQVQLSNRKTT
jgi:bacteriorhodopsin